MTLQSFPHFISIRKSSTHMSWSDDVEFLRFRYATATYDDDVICIKPCEPTDESVKCKEVRHLGRKLYLVVPYKIPNGIYVLNTIDLSTRTFCFKKADGH